MAKLTSAQILSDCTAFERSVLAAINNTVDIDPAKQTVEVQTAIQSLKGRGLVRKSCLNPAYVESSPKGAYALGYYPDWNGRE